MLKSGLNISARIYGREFTSNISYVDEDFCYIESPKNVHGKIFQKNSTINISLLKDGTIYSFDSSVKGLSQDSNYIVIYKPDKLIKLKGRQFREFCMVN